MSSICEAVLIAPSREFEAGILPLMASPLPSTTARRYIRARETLFKAYMTYYENKGHENPQASAFIRERYQYQSAEGLSLEDIARSEALGSIPLLSNTMPATFWLVYHIISDPAALADCREELTRTLRTGGGQDGAGADAVRSIDVGYIRRQCPVLLSTFKEVFRHHGIGVSSRVVLEDHLLDGRFLLRKGNVLLIPGVVQHQERSVWGEDAGEFSHRRFVAGGGGAAAAAEVGPKGVGRRLNAVAFRGFGGGSTLCPGRHFAATEIMAFAALFILRFDARPASGAGWSAPSVDKTNLATSIHQPDHDLEIEVRLRGEYRGRWEVKLSESDVPMEVSAEDMAPLEMGTNSSQRI